VKCGNQLTANDSFATLATLMCNFTLFHGLCIIGAYGTFIVEKKI